MKKIIFDIAKEYNCDVLVAGGGVSGISAAVNAARNGAKVILCEADGYLGGTATRGLVGPFMTCYDRTGENQIIRGFFQEFVDRMIAEGGAIHHSKCPGGDSYAGYRSKGHYGVTPIDPEVLKRVAEDMCKEAGVKLLYHSRVIGCDTENNTIKSAYIATPAGVEVINAKVYIDTTGNAALAEKAGAEVVFGDENGFVQTASLFFRISGVNKEKLDSEIAKTTDDRCRFFMDVIEESTKKGEFPCGTLKLRIYEGIDGVWTVNMAQEDSTVVDFDTEAVTAAEVSQRVQISKIFKFLKNNIPGLENIQMTESAAGIGIRESRRIVGKTMLSKDDLLNSRHYDERIAVCSNSIDVHMKKGVEYWTCEKNYYIPLSCLVSKNITNLMGAGKTMSADKYAFAAVRVMPPCFAMGEAAGITAALAKDGNVSDVDVKDVQKVIVKNGGYLE